MFARLLLAALASLALSSASYAQTLQPYKDRLFAYPRILAATDGGAYRVVDYQSKRDINQRDQVPERRVKRQYVDLKARRATKTAELNTLDGPLTYHYAGQLNNASLITIYIHGKGGYGKQGINDYSFGGNFNRIKMLMLQNNGLYLSPDAGNFTGADVRKIKTLIANALAQSPRARLVLGCGSSGGEVCYKLLEDNAIAARLGGVALMGSYWNLALIKSQAGRARVPVYIAHGSEDSTFPIANMEAFYKAVRMSGIPVRMTRFETGSHGTPIRMMDWRQAINWMLSN